jgi:hypothetical protein
MEFTLKEMDEMFRIAEIFKEKSWTVILILSDQWKFVRKLKISIRCYRVLYEEKGKKKNPPDNPTPIFIQERIIACMYSLYINKD